MAVHFCNISSVGSKDKSVAVRAKPENSARPYLKIKAKRDGIEHLSSKHKALGSNLKPQYIHGCMDGWIDNF
jgi:hypothetical protein